MLRWPCAIVRFSSYCPFCASPPSYLFDLFPAPLTSPPFPLEASLSFW